MGNIEPYKPWIVIDSSLVESFTNNYSFADLELSNITEYLQAVPPYMSATQHVLASGQYATEQECSHFYSLKGLQLVNMTGVLPIQIMRLPFFDENKNEVFYIGIYIVSMTEEYTISVGGDLGTWHYKNITVEGALYNADSTTLRTIFNLSTNIGYYDGNNLENYINFISAIDTYNDTKYISLGAFTFNDYNRYNPNHWNYIMSGLSVYIPYELMGGEFDSFEFSESLGKANDEEDLAPYGEGSFDDSSDDIAIPNNPSVGVSTSGCTNVYAISQSELQGFINELFPPFNGFDPQPYTSPTDVVTALMNITDLIATGIENVKPIAEMFINKGLIDFVIDCHLIPCNPNTNPKESIVVSWKTFSQTANVVTSDYVTVDCGELNIREYFGNFADYMTNCQLFLPFIGFVPCQPEFWQSGTIGVKYTFNVIDGSFMAYITSQSSKSNLHSVVAQYSGTCCVHIPITSASYASIVSGAMIASTGLVASVASGNGIGAVSSLASFANIRPELQQSNGYNASSSFLSIRKPFLLIARPSYYLSRDYKEESGIPDFVRHTVSDCVGYTELLAPVVDNISGIDDEEREELKRILESGFYA